MVLWPSLHGVVRKRERLACPWVSPWSPLLSDRTKIGCLRTKVKNPTLSHKARQGWGTPPIGMLILEPERLKNRLTTTRERIAGDGKGSKPRRTSGLRF